MIFSPYKALKLPTQPLELLYFTFFALIFASHSQNATEGLGKQNEGYAYVKIWYL
jgi:hypothetical protein